jgi:CheY-like chemotaxis protein
VDLLGRLFKQDQQAAAGSEPEAQPLALVLDDDPVCRHVVVAALRKAHFTAEGEGDPLATLPRLAEKHYGLILLDMEMPGMDGLEFCRRVRQMPGYQHTPIIFVTSHSDFDLRVKSTLSGGQDLISKPIFPLELAVKSVTQALKSQLQNPMDQHRRKEKHA